ncbi:UDP-N-acetylmuramoyl-tripeptide--D-alanyl-D-alanine ligase [Aestuariispira ectoiniformans]|uniref:UDP-N-acetylmuramoyl-tripeptide--D-alanyl-D- alanine ligase n=1 Tax=Aestuariispira ectoiniformans TaxID=2775080 RepID=UPI00223B9EF2|nr:UDP-N-acetylmuramoyl-tripeptide--D-alanyl-D-alanine ligase [Aestuariispira ectoiniformans]
MTVIWDHKAAEKATGGKASGPWEATGVSIDTRTITPGDLFVALKGPNHDGHAYLETARDKGAAAAIISDSDKAPEGLPVLTVTNTMGAMIDLAAAARTRMSGKVIAITGSVGKTGTKEGLALAFAALGKTHATLGNLNNEIGLPLTMDRIPADTDYSVLEMGMNHPGEIQPLSDLARPDVAIITTVQPVHLEFFEGIQGIADAKAEIFSGLNKGGYAILPRDHPLFHHMRERALEAGVAEDRIIGFGTHPDAHVRLLKCDAIPTGSRATAVMDGETRVYEIGMPGEHWAINSLAILAAVRYLGGDLDKAVEALKDWRPGKGRGCRHQISLPQGGSFTLIDESYNASPPAMRAAFDVLAHVKPHPGGRRVAILGDMLELGDSAPSLHAALASSIEENSIDMVFTAGPNMAHLNKVLERGRKANHAADSAALIGPVVSYIGAGDVVLVKGSLGMRMAAIVNALNALDKKGARDAV